MTFEGNHVLGSRVLLSLATCAVWKCGFTWLDSDAAAFKHNLKQWLPHFGIIIKLGIIHDILLLEHLRVFEQGRHKKHRHLEWYKYVLAVIMLGIYTIKILDTTVDTPCSANCVTCNSLMIDNIFIQHDFSQSISFRIVIPRRHPFISWKSSCCDNISLSESRQWMIGHSSWFCSRTVPYHRHVKSCQISLPPYAWQQWSSEYEQKGAMLSTC